MKYYQKTLLILTFLFSYLLSWSQGSFQLEDGTNLDYRTITNDVSFPWEILWGDDGMLWVTEKGSGSTRPQISRIDPTTGAKTTLYIPPADLMAEIDAPPGLLGMAFHPNFDANNPDSDPANGSNIVYITFTSGDFTQDLARLTYDGSSLSNLEILVQTNEAPSNHGSRLIITNDDKLLWSTGSEDAPRDGQNLDDLIGKTLRVNLDGSVPQDNPYFTTEDASRSKIFTYGHRNPQGIAQIPSNHPTLANFIYSSEHGSTQNDEINLLTSGNNYGWSLFEGYCTSNSTDNTCPLVTFDEAPTGLIYYDHPAIPEWSGALLMGTSKGSKLIRLLLNEAGEIINKDENAPTSNNIELENNNYEFDFSGLLARPRAMAMSPDGKVYVASLDAASDGSEDRIFVIENPDFSGCGSSGTPSCQMFAITTASDVTICDAQSLTIELSGSEQGASYELNINGSASGIVVEGSGCNINFELTPSLLFQNDATLSDGDVLTVVSTASGCSQSMTGSVTVNVSNSFSARYYPTTGNSEAPEFQGLTYQWYNDGGLIANETSRLLENSTSDARVIVTNCNCSVWAEAVDDRSEISFGHQFDDQFVHSSPISSQLDVPWAIEYGRDDNLWITERDLGQVLQVDPETGDITNALQLGQNESFDATTSPRAGLMGMAINWDADPVNFYLAYTYNDGSLKLRISSFEYDESASSLSNELVLVEDIPSQTNHGSALLLDNGYLYATTGSVD
ncbi:MAG: PQQ-dependent sugar dehydrogenase, partial [Bacteroidota bacterium]